MKKTDYFYDNNVHSIEVPKTFTLGMKVKILPLNIEGFVQTIQYSLGGGVSYAVVYYWEGKQNSIWVFDFEIEGIETKV